MTLYPGGRSLISDAKTTHVKLALVGSELHHVKERCLRARVNHDDLFRDGAVQEQAAERHWNALVDLCNYLVAARDKADAGFPFEDFATQAQAVVHEVCAASLDAALDFSKATMQALFACKNMSLGAEGALATSQEVVHAWLENLVSTAGALFSTLWGWPSDDCRLLRLMDFKALDEFLWHWAHISTSSPTLTEMAVHDVAKLEGSMSGALDASERLCAEYGGEFQSRAKAWWAGKELQDLRSQLQSIVQATVDSTLAPFKACLAFVYLLKPPIAQAPVQPTPLEILIKNDSRRAPPSASALRGSGVGRVIAGRLCTPLCGP